MGTSDSSDDIYRAETERVDSSIAAIKRETEHQIEFQTHIGARTGRPNVTLDMLGR
jgi:hypothetical protein